MKTLTFDHLMKLYRAVIERSGGSYGVRDQGGIESALAQPFASFGGEDLYPSLVEKAAALGFSLIKNHPFVDGNKRIGHAAMEAFLILNGYEIEASVDEQEQVILGVAAGATSRGDFVAWLERHVIPLS